MSRRKRVAAQIKQEVSSIMQEEMQDPQIGLLTIMHATVTADLHHSHIYVSCFGDAAQRARALEVLTDRCSYVRKLLGQRLRLRYTPDITFHLDESIDVAFRMQDTLDRIHEEPPTHGHT